MAHRLQGWTAIAYAEKHGGTLQKYTDPTERALKRVSIEKAKRVAREDARLIYMVVPSGFKGKGKRVAKNPRGKSSPSDIPREWTTAKVRLDSKGRVQIGLPRVPAQKRNPSKWKYELTFWGAAMVRKFPKYKRYHTTIQSARSTAARVQSILDEKSHLTGGSASHPPVIYDSNGKQV